MRGLHLTSYQLGARILYLLLIYHRFIELIISELMEKHPVSAVTIRYYHAEHFRDNTRCANLSRKYRDLRCYLLVNIGGYWQTLTHVGQDQYLRRYRRLNLLRNKSVTKSITSREALGQTLFQKLHRTEIAQVNLMLRNREQSFYIL
jgi:hypothetical protein